jgi:hypothetical protein
VSSSSRASVTVYNRCTVHLGLLLPSMFLVFTGELFGAARESIRLTLTLLLIILMMMMTMMQCCLDVVAKIKWMLTKNKPNVWEVSLPQIACLGFSVSLVSVAFALFNMWIYITIVTSIDFRVKSTS